MISASGMPFCQNYQNQDSCCSRSVPIGAAHHLSIGCPGMPGLHGVPSTPRPQKVGGSSQSLRPCMQVVDIPVDDWLNGGSKA